MIKEENENQSFKLPLSIIFTPRSIIMPFKEKLKLQLAFYRGKKICKTKPRKYVEKSPENQVALDHELLNLCTTISFDPFSRKFQSKKINLQIAFDVDGKKQMFEKCIDLEDLLKYEKEFKRTEKVSFSEEISLIFGVEGTFQNLPEIKPRMNNILKENVLLRKNQKAKSKKVITFEPGLKDDSYQVKNKSMKIFSKPKSAKSSAEDSSENQPKANSILSLKTDKDASILSAKYGQKIKGLEKQVQSLKKNKVSLEKRISFFEKEFEMKEKQVQELKIGRERAIKEKQQSINKHKSEQSKLMAKIDWQSSQISKILKKMEIMDNQHQKQIRQFQQNLKTKTTTTKGESSQKNQEKVIDELKRSLDSKQLILKILNQSNQNQKENAKHDYSILKKENDQLRKKLTELKNNSKGDSNEFLDMKLAFEKLKKENQQIKKVEKTFLSEKLCLQTQNNSMQKQLVSLKETIAKILNLIQQESLQLFTKVADCMYE